MDNSLVLQSLKAGTELGHGSRVCNGVAWRPQDGVVLARILRDAFRGSGPGGSGTSEVAAALREYERQRSRRVFPVTARSAAFGILLQIPYAPVSDRSSSAVGEIGTQANLAVP